MPNPITMLKADHVKVKGLLRQLEASGVPGRLGPDYGAAVAARERAEQRISQASMTQVLAGRALTRARNRPYWPLLTPCGPF